MKYIKITSTVTLLIALFFFSKWVYRVWPRYEVVSILEFREDVCRSNKYQGICEHPGKIYPDEIHNYSDYSDGTFFVGCTTFGEKDLCYVEKKVRTN